MSQDEPPNHQELLEFQSKLKILHQVSAELSKADSFDDLCRRAVELGCEKLGFDRLSIWFFDADPHYLCGSFGIDEHGQLRDERAKRLEVRDDRLVSEALESRAPVVVNREGPLYDDNSVVVGHGWNAMAILWDGDRSIGLLTADNLLNRQPLSDYQLELLVLYGTTIGHLATRKRIEDALRASEEAARRFQQKLIVLHDVTTELSKADSFDALCRRAIELGRSKLGFDRLGLWFFDADSAFMVGSYGTDENGLLRDERGERIPANFDSLVEALGGRVLVSGGDPLPLFNQRQEVMGYGWKAAAKVWDGDRTIGWLSTDNLFSHRPMSEYELELLALYASALGHLATNIRADERLASERNLLRTIIDAAPDFIFVKDTAGRFVLVNRASWLDTPGGVDESSLIGKTDFDILPPERAQRFWEDDQEVMSSGNPIVNQEEEGRSKAGEFRWLLVSKVPLRDGLEQITGLVGVARDITDLKQVESQSVELAVERERVKFLTAFITNISHDLKTPLSIINSSLYLLGRITEPDKQRDKLEIIKSQTLLLEQFIEDILTISRLDSSPPMARKLVNLNAVLGHVGERLHTSASGKNITVTFALDDELPGVFGDERELHRTFVKLVENAVNYTQEGGSVTVRTARSGDQVVVEVADTGIGIGEDDLPYVFDRFYRADKARPISTGGTGLGLAIVKRIIEIHSGKIEVSSAVGQGTNFRILLPVADGSKVG